MAENVTTKFRVDISDLKKNIAEANANVKRYTAELENATAGMKKGEETADALTRKIEVQNKIVEAEKQKLAALKAELQRYEDTLKKGESEVADLTKKHEQAAAAFGKDSTEAQKLAKQLQQAQAAQERNAKAADDLRVKIINQDSAVKRAESQTNDFRKSLESLTTTENQTAKGADNLGDELEETGKDAGKATSGGLSAFTVALGNLAANVITAAVKKLEELGKAAIKAYDDFDKGRDALIKATGAIGETADELTAIYANVSKSVVGDLNSIGSAIGEVNTRFGFTGAELEKASEDFLKFADITGTDATTAVRLVSRAMGDAGIESENYAELLDDLATAAQASGIKLETLTEYLTKYGAPMRALGFDTKEAIAIFSQWEKAGVNTEIAFSGMKTAISKWSADGKDARIEFEKTLAEIQNTPTIAAATTKAIEAFGKKAGPDLADAIKNGRFEYSEFLDVLSDSAGTVENTYAETQSGIDKIKLSIQSLKVTAGEAAGAIVDDFAPSIQGILSALGGALNGEQGAAESLGKALSDLLEKAFDFVVQSAPDMMRTFGTLLSNSIPVLLETALSNTPELVDTLLTSTMDLFDSVITKLPQLLTTFATDFAPKMLKVISKLIERLATSLPQTIKILVPAVTQALGILMDVMIDNLPVILDGIVSLLSAAVQALPDIMPALMSLVSKIMQMIGGLLADPTSLQFVIDFVAAVGVELIRGIGAIIAGIWQSISPQLTELYNALKDSFVDFIGGIVIEFNEWIAGVKQRFHDFVTAWADGFSEIVKKFKAAFEKIKESFKGFTAAWSDGFASIVTGAKNAWEKIKGAFSTVGEFFGGIWDTIKEKFTTIGTKIGDAVGGAFKNAINAVLATVENSINFVPQAINNALDLINQLPGVDIPYMPNIQLPRLSTGGIVNKSTVANIGEAGEEAVIPLEKNTGGLRKIAGLLANEIQAMPAQNTAQQVQNTYTFTQTNNSPKALNRWEVYRQTQNLMRQMKGATV